MASSNQTGQLVKAKLEFHDKVKGASGLEFQFNPTEMTMQKSAQPVQQKTASGNAPDPQHVTGGPAVLKFSTLWFDTYEEGTSVYAKYISKLERMAHVDEELHRPPHVLFMWGANFGAKADQTPTFVWQLADFSVTYTMFLPDATPVRASCTLTLKEVPQKPKQLKSPDTAHVRLLQRGDTLQAIAAAEYDDPAQWRRIADANGIDDPLNLMPGRRLLIPPILK